MIRLNAKVKVREKNVFNLNEIMSTDVITVMPSAPVSQANSLMRDKRIRHLPVIDENQHLVGLLTRTDLFAATDSFLRDKEDRMAVTDFPVEDVMVTDVVTVNEQVSIRHAARLIEQHRIGCLPVLNGGKLTGIITDTDFVGVAINLLEQMESSEPEEPDADLSFDDGELI